MKTYFTSIFSIAAIAVSACISISPLQAQENADKHKGPAAETSDDQFVQKAAMAGLKEVNLGKLAAEKAAMPKVKEFAAMMVADHGKANDELMQLSAAKRLKLAPTLDKKDQKASGKLAKMSGAGFDKEYVDEMVKDHEKAVDLFTEAGTKVKDADLKAFAEKTLPTLKHHLEEAKALKAAMK